MLWEWANDRSTVFILDLDGTLMPSAEIDNQCFWEAVFRCYGKKESLPDLHGFKHVTDTGILDEWCIGEIGRPPLRAETEQIKQLFLQLLQAAASSNPAQFTALPGVCDWLEAVSKNAMVHAGIATGGWERSASMKMKLSGLDRFNLPLASSDDAAPRTEIMRNAAQKTFIEPLDFEADYIYIGDRIWDLQASQELGWGFIGIATGAPATLLQQAGATHIQPDFR
ncbi:MAG: HAD hydrolase-like protein [Xanthomonadales bacterium]|nr:HAD hydrolase-like protein [Xanthomonadales bacterium]